MTVKDQKILDNYIDELTLSGKSIKNPKSALKIFFNYLDDYHLNYTEVKISDAQDFQGHLVTKTKRGKLVYTKRSVRTMTGCVTAFYEWLAKKKIIYANPFLEIKKLRSPRLLPKNILDEAKTDKLLKALRDFNNGKNLIERKALYKAHVVAELMYSTGARINEIAELKLIDIDFIRGIVTINDTKSNQVRESILNEYASKVLQIFINDMREYINFGKNNADKTLVFGTRKNLQMWFNAVLKKASKKLRFGKYTSHHIRHSVGVHLLKNGCDIRYIQEILGHKKLSSTQIYTQISREDLRNVIDKFHPRTFQRIKNEK